VYSVADCCLQRDKVPVGFSVLPHTTFIVEYVNCTYSNYTEAAATCSAAQQERKNQSDVCWSGAEPVVWIYRCVRICTRLVSHTSRD